MRIVLNVLPLFLLVMTASAQTAPSYEPTETADEQSGLCPRTHNLELAPSAQYWLEGVIGSKTVKMFLERGGSGVVGLFYAPDGDWTPVLLGGMWKPSGIDLSAGADTAAFDPETPAPIGRLQGQLTDSVFLGQWTPKGGQQSEPVRMSVVPKTECDGKGSWKRFDSPKWPFSFSYPASWHLVEEHDGPGDYIRLICPDPGAMAYATDVTVSEGLGEPPAETGLVRCGKSWRFYAECGEDIKDSVYSHIPAQSVRHGMRILDISDHEWRVYCRSGGYVGQTDGADRVVLLQTGWTAITMVGNDFDIVERIVDTVRAHTAK
jgi:rhodanese-related sulfurtransferase